MARPSSNSVLSTTLALIALQLSSRLLSFSLNQLLLRSVSPSAFGLATIQLDTLIGTVLFLLREGIRGAVVRTRTPHRTLPRSRTFLLPTFFSPLALLAFFLYSRFSSPSPLPVFYTPTLALYALSTLLELFSEPRYLLSLENWEDLTAKRVKVEGAAVMVKALVTLAVVKRVSEADALVAFGAGQLAYSATICAGLAWITRGYSARPDPSNSSSSSAAAAVKTPAPSAAPDPRFDPALLSLSWALTKQSAVKQLLTEGDKLGVGKFGSGEDMGGYAVALNYGSLIARILFQPLEESSRLYFSSLATTSTAPSLPTLLSLSTYLHLLLLLHTHLALLFLLLAPSYTTPLLTLLLGRAWASTAGPSLRAYCLSLPFLGLNGLIEAFFQSLASPRWIARGSAWMVVCALGFAAATGLFVGALGWGARGLVAANCVNMALRIGFSTRFMRAFFRDGLGGASPAAAGPHAQAQTQEVKRHLAPSSWTPNKATLLVFVVGAWVVRASEGRWTAAMSAAGVGAGAGRLAGLRALAEHLGVGAAVGVSCLGVVYATRKDEVRSLVAAIKHGPSGEGQEDGKKDE
ncbi:hypothetical protein JCM6882_008591 [Rhodosporidiobolus microsporus]